MATLEITIHSFRPQQHPEPESEPTPQDSLIERVEGLLDEHAPARKPSEPTEERDRYTMAVATRHRLRICQEIRVNAAGKGAR